MQKIKKPHSRWKRLLFPFVFLAIMLVPIVSVVAESISGDNIIVESSETLEKTSFLAGENIRVDGNVNGTTFITGGNIEVNGVIDGDLFVVAQNLTVNGMVKGSIFLTGQAMSLNGEIENNMYAVGQRLNIQSQIDGSLFMAGQNIAIEENALIERDAFIGAGTVYHNGVVKGDFQSSSDSLAFDGKVGGDLNYSSQNQADFSNTSEVLGETTWKKIETNSAKETRQFFSVSRFLRAIWNVIAALIVWLLVRWIRPTFWLKLTDEIRRHPLKTLGFGALGVVFIPFLSLLLMMTVIGIPLSLILLVFYGVTLYSSKIILSVYLSRFLQNRWDGSNVQAFWLFLLTLIVLIGLGAIPIVGMMVGFLTVSLGVGAIGFALIDRPPLN